MGSISNSSTVSTATVATVDTPFSIIRISFNGRNGAGGISIPGLHVGDTVIWMFNSNGGPPPTANGGWTEWVITAADEIQQTWTNDLSSDTFEALLIRGA